MSLASFILWLPCMAVLPAVLPVVFNPFEEKNPTKLLQQLLGAVAPLCDCIPGHLPPMPSGDREQHCTHSPWSFVFLGKLCSHWVMSQWAVTIVMDSLLRNLNGWFKWSYVPSRTWISKPPHFEEVCKQTLSFQISLLIVIGWDKIFCVQKKNAFFFFFPF